MAGGTGCQSGHGEGVHREGCMGLPSAYPSSSPLGQLAGIKKPTCLSHHLLVHPGTHSSNPSKAVPGIAETCPSNGVRCDRPAQQQLPPWLPSDRAMAPCMVSLTSQGSVDAWVEAVWVEDKSWQLECHSTSPAPHWDNPTAGFSVCTGCIGAWGPVASMCVVWRCLGVCATCLCPLVGCRYTQTRTEPWSRGRSGVKGVE